MASISSLSGSTNSALSSLRGYGGLSSGLDRDTLIEGMTSATQAKITKNQQAKQKLEWQQQAYRNISDKLIAFADKYTATMTSKTNLFSDSFWNAANTIVNGKNSKYIGVTGTSKAAANVSILGVQQMAKNASLMTGKASDSALKTGAINTGDVPMNTLDGKELNFKIGDNGYAVVLPSRLEPYAMADGTQDVEAAAKAINAALRQTKVDYTGAPKDDNMFNHVEAQVVDGKIAFVSKDGNNKVTLHDSSALEALGFTTKPGSEGQELTNGVAYSAQEEAKLIEVQDFAQRMGEKELTFNYNAKTGLNMDAVRLMGEIVKETAKATKDEDSLGCAKLVVFCNAPDDNPFMAGAFHGVTEADAIINVGVSGPGVVKEALKQARGENFEVLCKTIKKTAFKITRVGQLVAQEASKRLGVPFGIIDLSLAPTPAVGDSVAEILEEIGLESVGAPGTTAALAMLNDQVKKGGVMASSYVGGLSGAFIPVSEDQGMIVAVSREALTLEKLEAMTCVCSVGLDMIAIPGDTTPSTIAGIIADEAAIGMINQKTTAVRIIPVIGKTVGDTVEFGGLLGYAPVMPVNQYSCEKFVTRGGRIPAPIHSFKN